MSSHFSIPFVGLRHSRLVLYQLPVHRRVSRKPPPVPDADPLTPKNPYSGEVTEGSARRLKKAFENLLEIATVKEHVYYRPVEVSPGHTINERRVSRFRLSFLTLTLAAPQGDVNDRQIQKECFEPLLRTLRNRFPDISYVWKAEVQGNGNLHYHITTDHYVDYRWLRTRWNRQVAKLGFIKAFAAKHGHDDPNSVDVKAVKDDRGLASYMKKYVCKKEPGKRRLNIKVWDCSRNLKAPETRNIPLDAATRLWIDDLIRSERVQRIECDNCVVLQAPEQFCLFDLPPALRDAQAQYIVSLKSKAYVSSKSITGSVERHLERPVIPPGRDQSTVPDEGGYRPIRRLGQQTQLVHRAGRLQAYYPY